jgi:hypothetical protein
VQKQRESTGCRRGKRSKDQDEVAQAARRKRRREHRQVHRAIQRALIIDKRHRPPGGLRTRPGQRLATPDCRALAQAASAAPSCPSLCSPSTRPTVSSTISLNTSKSEKVRVIDLTLSTTSSASSSPRSPIPSSAGSPCWTKERPLREVRHKYGEVQKAMENPTDNLGQDPPRGGDKLGQGKFRHC